MNFTAVFSSVIMAATVILCSVTAEADPICTSGSRGSDVARIQTRLDKWGYYHGRITGVYDDKTIAAVELFQRRNGLQETGVTENNTLSQLGLFSGDYTQSKTEVFENTLGKVPDYAAPARSKAAAAANSISSATQKEMMMLARVISGESRGESFTGQVAVGAVVLNRVKAPGFPKSIEDVIMQPGAFSAVRDGQYDMKPTKSSIEAAKEALGGKDPTSGAVYYWNPRTTTAKWTKRVPIVARIGNHVFARNA